MSPNPDPEGIGAHRSRTRCIGAALWGLASCAQDFSNELHRDARVVLGEVFDTVSCLDVFKQEPNGHSGAKETKFSVHDLRISEQNMF